MASIWTEVLGLLRNFLIFSSALGICRIQSMPIAQYAIFSCGVLQGILFSNCSAVVTDNFLLPYSTILETPIEVSLNRFLLFSESLISAGLRWFLLDKSILYTAEFRHNIATTVNDRIFEVRVFLSFAIITKFM